MNESNDINIKTIIIPSNVPKPKIKQSTSKLTKGNGEINDNTLAFSLEGYSEIKAEYLVHLHGAWVKYVDKTNKNCFKGGFLNSIDLNEKIIYLRIPQRSEIIEVNIDNMYFYVKSDLPNFISLQNMILEKQKNKRRLNNIMNYLANIQEHLEKPLVFRCKRKPTPNEIVDYRFYIYANEARWSNGFYCCINKCRRCDD